MDEILVDKLKKFLNSTNNVDTAYFETVYLQMQSDLSTKSEQLEKTLKSIDEADTKITELRQTLEQNKTEEDELNDEIFSCREYLSSLEKEMRENQETSVENEEKSKRLSLENDVLRESISKEKAKNINLKEKLVDMEKRVQNNNLLLEEAKNGNSAFTEILSLIHEEIETVENLQNNVLNFDKLEKISEQVHEVGKTFDNKLKELNKEEAKILSEITEFEVEFNELQKQFLENGKDEPDSYDYLLAKFMATQCKKNISHFKNTVKIQDLQIEKVIQRVKRSSEDSEKLNKWIKTYQEENEKLKLKKIEKIELKNEIESSDDDLSIIDATFTN